jgi:hypothetical protein
MPVVRLAAYLKGDFNGIPNAPQKTSSSRRPSAVVKLPQSRRTATPISATRANFTIAPWSIKDPNTKSSGIQSCILEVWLLVISFLMMTLLDL